MLAMSPKIGSPPLRVLLFVWPELDVEDFRPIKQQWVAKHLQMQQPAVSAVLQTLVAERFLEQGPKAGRSNTYRINADHEVVKTIYKDPLYNVAA
jgi:hypothetical protein